MVGGIAAGHSNRERGQSGGNRHSMGNMGSSNNIQGMNDSFTPCQGAKSSAEMHDEISVLGSNTDERDYEDD